MRIGYKGAYALDKGAVIMVLERLSDGDLELELLKMQRLFYETYIKGAKNG